LAAAVLGLCSSRASIHLSPQPSVPRDSETNFEQGKDKRQWKLGEPRRPVMTGTLEVVLESRSTAAAR
jgi:hypothetical protein